MYDLISLYEWFWNESDQQMSVWSRHCGIIELWSVCYSWACFIHPSYLFGDPVEPEKYNHCVLRRCWTKIIPAVDSLAVRLSFSNILDFARNNWNDNSNVYSNINVTSRDNLNKMYLETRRSAKLANSRRRITGHSLSSSRNFWSVQKCEVEGNYHICRRTITPLCDWPH